MQTILQFQIKSVYGNDLIYPVSKEAIVLTNLTGKKTMLKSDLISLKEIGFSIEFITQTINF